MLGLRRDYDNTGATKGVVLTGQPGVGATTHRRIGSPGKTTFPNFMLARLISARQVVLPRKPTQVHLFYYGQVYSRPTVLGLEGLPENAQTPHFPIWALVDADLRKGEPPIIDTSNVWPIQASSPNPARWDSWSEQYRAAELGMPLWNMEELMEGYVFSLFSLSAIDPGHVVR